MSCELDVILEFPNSVSRQAKKSTTQLNTLRFLKSGKKIGHFSEWDKPDVQYLDSIPGRSKVNRRAETLRKKQQEERARLDKSSHDWTPTDKFGNLDISLDVQVLQVPEKSFLSLA